MDTELKDLVLLTHKLVNQYEDPMNCELFEHYFMGLGQDPDSFFGLRFITLHSGMIRAQGETASGWEHLADYKVTCTDVNRCLISDIATGRVESVKTLFRQQLHRLKIKKSCD